jgi:hypothetical protein
MATFAETMLAKYETLLQTSAGLDTVSGDGKPVMATGRAVVGSVRYTDLEAKCRYWNREVARQAGQRPQAAARRFSLTAAAASHRVSAVGKCARQARGGRTMGSGACQEIPR